MVLPHKRSRFALRSAGVGMLLLVVVFAVAIGFWGTPWRMPLANNGEVRYEFVAFWRGENIPSGAFDRPFGIAMSAEGDLYVTDARRRVIRLSAQGEFKDEWGGAGNQPGQFQNAVGIAVGADGSVFVTDYDLDRIQKLTADGKFVSAFGSSGSNPGEFNAPAGVAVDGSGTIDVADFYNSRVAQFGSDGALRKIIGHPGRLGGGALHYPTDVHISSDGMLIVADAYNYQLQWFDSDGRPKRRVGRHLLWLWPRPVSSNKGFGVPTGVAIAGDFIYVADSGNHRVVMLTKRGEYIAEWKIPDPVPNVHSPEKVAVSPDGHTVYATDYAANRIAVLRVVETPEAREPPTSANRKNEERTDMKKKIKLLAATFTMMFVLTAALAQTTPNHAYIQVKGLACPFCVQGLEKHLKKIPGVAGVTTSLEKGEIVVHIDDPQKVTEDQLRKAVKDAGFTVGAVRIEKGGTDPGSGTTKGGRQK